MSSTLTRGTSLPTQIVEEIFSSVRGESALAKLSNQRPIPFNGTTEMVFSMDNEASIVGENAAKVNGGATANFVIVRPLKFEYGVRVSDEFKYGTEEYRMNVLRTFAEGAAKKFARGLDIAGFHGFNPYSGTASALVGNNHLDYAATNVVGYNSATPRAGIRTAISLIQSYGADPTGIAYAPAMADALADEVTNGIPANREFYDSIKPATFLGLPAAINQTVFKGNHDMAVMGDWSAFRWGYSKDIPLEVIEYGDPDNAGSDLKGHNQIYLRAEAYIGWGILVPDWFALLKTTGGLTLASEAGDSAGKTAITVTETKATGNIWKYKVADTATSVIYGQDLSAWTTWDGSADITAATGKVLTLAECTSAGKAVNVGSVTVTAHA